MSLIIRSGPANIEWIIDATSQAGRATLYDPSGNVLSPVNRGALAETAGGVVTSGKEYKLARTDRSLPDGQKSSNLQPLLLSQYHTTVKDAGMWIESGSVMSAGQTVAAGLTLNSTSSVAANANIVWTSHRQFLIPERGALIFRTRLRNIRFNNSIAEWGIGAPVGNTAVVNDGAFFRKDTAGSLQGVISQNGTEIQSSVMTAPADTDYAFYEIFYCEGRAFFQIVSDAGVVISAVDLPATATTARAPSVSHLPCFHRLYNGAVGPGTAPQVLVDRTAVYLTDAPESRPWREIMSGQGWNSSMVPGAGTQAAQAVNSATPAGVALANTTAPHALLGGLTNGNAMAAGLTTDLILVGYQVPSPYMFYFTGVRIDPPVNLVVAVATTDTQFALYGMAFNSSAVSLATAGTYPPMRVPLGGNHKFTVADPVGRPAAGSPVIWQPNTPIAVMPGRFIHVYVRCMIGTATATETYLWAIAIDGWFE